MGNVTGAIVNVDEFRVHANHDGTVDKTRTDLYLHLVDRHDNSILEVDEVLRLVDQNTEKLDGLFKVNYFLKNRFAFILTVLVININGEKKLESGF